MTSSQQNIKSQGKLINKETNPCLKEHNLTNNCLVENNYDKEKCELYFENYRNCKQFWLAVQVDRRRKGITPEMPSLEERNKIMEERKRNLSSTSR
ncbi:coiled-coil-helix-coiled-coil-helix domain-containing protein 7 [Copidosoma floridanum]|uniref:coiled-coil-helix-coiled-coil-helix domain-containing protein 7 n=1 Tax=Copidosoma floridanum TaxID=29053 RepID=UPI0006C99644|nr:coiled-coil-helix-coiled-coil-helix domain-containing protein 7 [Copidosoma floridanum]